MFGLFFSILCGGFSFFMLFWSMHLLKEEKMLEDIVFKSVCREIHHGIEGLFCSASGWAVIIIVLLIFTIHFARWVMHHRGGDKSGRRVAKKRSRRFS